MPTATDDTRSRLISAAERLFAQRGVEGVSMREINRAAAQGNASALQYHFGDRRGLLRALISKHKGGIDSRRHALLDRYEAEGVTDLRALAAALVLPLASKLSDVDGGRAYLQVVAELVNRPDPVLDPAAMDDPTDSIHRWRTLLDPLLPTESTRVFHTRFVAIRFTHVELARRAAGRPRRDDRLYVSHLVDLVTALLAAPHSEQTRRLLRERAR
ncbi:MAG: TetR/AcrR family transcriptional regulator [Acidimicrobiia bacterium]|nr:TetR/AcrR family transcriptional regulator [Acidimicrobiia bacterium]